MFVKLKIFVYCLNAGADKVSINSAAIYNLRICIKKPLNVLVHSVLWLPLMPKKTGENKWEIFTHGGRKETGIDAIEWAVKMADFGAGELLVTSMDADGTKAGYDLALDASTSMTVSPFQQLHQAVWVTYNI